MASPCSNDPNEVLEKIVSIKNNADKFDTFVNGTSAQSVQLGSGVATPTLRNAAGIILGGVDNAGKFDKFVNGTATETVQLGSGSPTPTIRNAVRQIMADASWAKQFIANAPEGDVSLNNAASLGTYVSRTLAERFAEVSNAKDFGAKGAGIVSGTSYSPWYSSEDDDAISIQAAIDYRSEHGGGYVYLPAGIYVVGTTIHLRSNVILLGDGINSTFLVKATPDYTNISLYNSWTDYDLLDACGTASTIASHIKRCGIRDLSLSNNITDDASAVMANRQITALSNGNEDPVKSALHIEKCSYFLSEDCAIYGRGRGIYMEETFDSRFINTDVNLAGCVVYDGSYSSSTADIVANGFCDSPAIEMKNVSPVNNTSEPTVSGTVNNVYFYGCRIETYCNTAVKIPHSDGQCNVIHFTDCKFESHQLYYHSVINLWYAFDFVLDTCLLEDDTRNRTYTAYLDTCRTCTFDVYLVLTAGEDRKKDVSSFRCVVCNGCIFNLRCGSTLNNTGDFVESGVALISPSQIEYFEDNNTVDVNPKSEGFLPILGSGYSKVVRAEDITIRDGVRVNGVIFDSISYPQKWAVGRIRSIGNNKTSLDICHIDDDVMSISMSISESGIYPGESGTIYFGSQSALWRSIYAHTLYAATRIMPIGDNTVDLGSTVERFQDAYIINGYFNNLWSNSGTVSSSDERLKASISDPDDALMRAWSKVNFKVFQFKDAIEEKGAEEARLHVGVIAQEVQEAFASEGLDASRYGLFCLDEWEDEYETVVVVDVEESFDHETGETVPAQTHEERRLVREAGSRYGIRYDEALALECAYQRWLGEKRDVEIEALKARLAALEG